MHTNFHYHFFGGMYKIMPQRVLFWASNPINVVSREWTGQYPPVGSRRCLDHLSSRIIHSLSNMHKGGLPFVIR